MEQEAQDGGISAWKPEPAAPPAREQRQGSSATVAFLAAALALTVSAGLKPGPCCIHLLMSEFIALAVHLHWSLRHLRSRLPQVVMAAGRGLQEAQKTAVLAQHQASLEPEPAPLSGPVGAHYRASILGGPDLHHSAVWDAACNGSARGAPPRRVQLHAAQTRRLVARGVYRRRKAGGAFSSCRSDAPPGAPLPQLRGVALLRSSRPRP